MSPTPYTMTTFSPSSTYSCFTYRADLSHKYGICESLHPDLNAQTLDLQGITIGGMPAGDAISILILACGAAALLVLLKWALDIRATCLGWIWVMACPARSSWWGWAVKIGEARTMHEMRRSLNRSAYSGLRVGVDGAERGWKGAGSVLYCREEDEWKWR